MHAWCSHCPAPRGTRASWTSPRARPGHCPGRSWSRCIARLRADRTRPSRRSRKINLHFGVQLGLTYMEDIERGTLAFDQAHDGQPDAGALPSIDGWESTGDDGVTRRTVTLEGSVSRTGWYVAAGLLGVVGLAVIFIALPPPSLRLAGRPAQSHQRVDIPPARHSPYRRHHPARSAREPKRQPPPRRVSRHRTIHHQVVVPAALASSPAPAAVAVSPPAAPPAAPVSAEEQPQAPQRRSGGQFSYLGG